MVRLCIDGAHQRGFGQVVPTQFLIGQFNHMDSSGPVQLNRNSERIHTGDDVVF